jgi:2-dehydro-3-deoxyphosphogluconate aldolase/(4S)-4-hydroxy-2-oxoglutarate aldolase
LKTRRASWHFERKKMDVFEQFYQTGVIPVVEIDNADHAVPLAEALARGGLPIAEITLRTAEALDAIRLIARGTSNILVGAGTVLNREQAQAAVASGARFLVSPGLPEDVVSWALENSIPILPGTITPTEIIRAINLGLNLLKFFPAETMGGLRAIQAISDPFPGVKFIPTGGIRLENMADYLVNAKIHAVGGSWMCKRQFIAAGQFGEIERLACQAAGIVKEIRQR